MLEELFLHVLDVGELVCGSEKKDNYSVETSEVKGVSSAWKLNNGVC